MYLLREYVGLISYQIGESHEHAMEYVEIMYDTLIPQHTSWLRRLGKSI